MLKQNNDQFLLLHRDTGIYAGDKEENKVEMQWNSSAGKHEIRAGAERATRYSYDDAYMVMTVMPWYSIVPVNPNECTWGSHGTWDKHNKRYV